MMTNNPEQAFLKVYVTSKKETKSLRCKDRERALESLCYM